ncbi:MAG: 2,3-bisphosphoglycerate-independent phosphoglycerate mutase [Candidatus Thorarchaeota archaeon]|jgi:2,3-bisphosphoglycerate-independent phosphoglycerate mutase
MSKKHTAVLIVLDGLGDRPVPDLKGKTPLQAAKTPFLDKLAKEGQSGLVDIISPGVTPGSDTAHLALFGYDPVESYPGRGPLEALGAGLPSKPGDVAFRSNFGTVDVDMKVIDRRAGRAFTSDEGAILQDVLKGIEIDGVKVHFIATVEHRGAVVLEGKGLSGEITDTDPHETGVKPLESNPLIPKAKKTSDVVNKLTVIAHERLKDIDLNADRIKRGLPPANTLLLRGAGQHGHIPTLQERFGIKSAVIAGGALYIGTAKYVGMEHILVEGQTGTIDTNFEGIAEQAINCVHNGYDYVFLHIKATDNASHDLDYDQKMLAIERTDGMIGRILEKVEDKVVISVTGDHSTPVTIGEHTCDPVPVLLWSKFLRADSVSKFSEIDAAQGALHRIRGSDVMPTLLGYAGFIKKFGA